jgi:hypothetical protein
MGSIAPFDLSWHGRYPRIRSWVASRLKETLKITSLETALSIGWGNIKN